MLASAGYTASKPLQSKYLYRSDSQASTAVFNNLSSQLSALGSVKVIGVPTNQADFYGKYLVVPNTKSAPSPPTRAPGHGGSSWGRLVRNSAVTYFNPLYSSPGGFPATAAATSVLLQHRRHNLIKAGAEPAHRGEAGQVLGQPTTGPEGGGDLPIPRRCSSCRTRRT